MLLHFGGRHPFTAATSTFSLFQFLCKSDSPRHPTLAGAGLLEWPLLVPAFHRPVCLEVSSRPSCWLVAFSFPRNPSGRGLFWVFPQLLQPGLGSGFYLSIARFFHRASAFRSRCFTLLYSQGVVVRRLLSVRSLSHVIDPVGEVWAPSPDSASSAFHGLSRSRSGCLLLPFNRALSFSLDSFSFCLSITLLPHLHSRDSGTPCLWADAVL